MYVNLCLLVSIIKLDTLLFNGQLNLPPEYPTFIGVV
jgi:hypothetical protein